MVFSFLVFRLSNGLIIRNKFVNVQGNKKRNTQNIQAKKQQKKLPFDLFFVDKPKSSRRGPLSQKFKIIGVVTNMYQKLRY